MKIPKIFEIKLIMLVIFVLLIGINSNRIKQILDYSPEYNQNNAFPNNFEAATNVTQLETANFTNPLFSQILNELSPRKKLIRKEFLENIRFQVFRLTKGEAENIFEFADSNKNDLLEEDEWDSFNSLYLLPFEACDRNHDYLLDIPEFENCFLKDPRSSFIIFRRKHEEKNELYKIKEIMNAISSRSKELLNFHDYIFIRRAMFAWKNCHSSSKFISKGAFQCAVKSSILNRVHFTGDLGKIYDVAINFGNDSFLVDLDFINYLKTLYCIYLFTSFGQPINIAFVERQAIIKSIREDRLPTNFQESEINFLFELTNSNPLINNLRMSYESFHYFWLLHRLFNKYSISRPLQITKEELFNLLEDSWIDNKLLSALGVSETNFSSAEYQSSSLILQRKRVNEAKYFFSFKQDASENTAALWNKSTVNATSQDPEKNPDVKEVFFTIFTTVNKETWTKESFYRAFLLGNLYTSLITDETSLVSSAILVDKLYDQYETVTPPISYLQRSNFVMYKYLPHEVNVDVLLFFAIENYNFKFQSYLKSSVLYPNENYVRLALKDFGMEHMPDTVLDLARKNNDNLNRRTFNTKELIKNCIIVQSVAAENKRSKEFTDKHIRKVNYDPSRRFPTQTFRAKASPWV